MADEPGKPEAKDGGNGSSGGFSPKDFMAVKARTERLEAAQKSKDEEIAQLRADIANAQVSGQPEDVAALRKQLYLERQTLLQGQRDLETAKKSIAEERRQVQAMKLAADGVTAEELLQFQSEPEMRVYALEKQLEKERAAKAAAEKPQKKAPAAYDTGTPAVAKKSVADMDPLGKDFQEHIAKLKREAVKRR